MGVAFYLHFLYSVPSLILYGLIFYVTVKNRKELKGPYYTLLRFSFFIDVLGYLTNFFGIWILSVTILNDWFLSLNSEPILLTFVLYINKVLLHAQNIRCVLGCLHRFTVIVWPMKTERYWERAMFPLLCLVPVWGFIVAIYSWFLGPWLRENNGQLYWEFNHPNVLIFPTLGAVLFYLTCTWIPNSITIRALVKHRREKVADRICSVTFCCGIVQICNLLTMASIGLSQANGWYISQFVEINILPLTRDAYSFSYPWFSMFLNVDVRRRVLGILHIRIGSKVKDASGTSFDSGRNKRITQVQTLSATELGNSKVTFTLDTIEMEKNM